MENIILSIISLLTLIALSSAAPHTVTDQSSDSKELQTGASQLAEKSSQAEDSGYTSEFKLNLLPLPVKNAESVNLEKEGIPSKILSFYDGSQQKFADISNPVPIIDTIREDEKFGNNGDMFDGISRSIVNGYETFSNLLNTLIQKPKELARSISKGITAQLDVLGGKLVGL